MDTIIVSLFGCIDVFDQQFRDFDANCVDEIGECLSNRVSAYSVETLSGQSPESESTFAGTRVDDVTSFLIKWGTSIKGTALTDHKQFCISFSVDGQADTIDPHLGRISPERHHARVFHWNAGTQVVVPRSNRVLNFAVAADVLERRARSYTNEEINGALRFSPLLDLRSPQGVAIRRMVDMFLCQATLTAHVFESALLRASMQEMVISNLLTALEHNYCEKGQVRLDGAGAVPRSVKRAEEYMRAHADRPITSEILACEAGCSERALQNAFKTFRNMTPMGRLREIRLELAHEELLRATGTVTEIAFKWGFGNLGRFSAHYAAKYNQTPSQTLRFFANSTTGTRVAV